MRLTSEFFGSLFLLLVVVGSGIMGERLAGGNEAIALLANSLATGAGLYVLIQCLAPLSGAHLNPVVSLVECFHGRLVKRDLPGYWAAQFSGALAGVWLTHLLFGLSVFQLSAKNRAQGNLWLSELVATFGLLSVITLAGRARAASVPAAVALYITGAYWFTSSTSFANPAVTVARAFTDTFCGIELFGVAPFIFAQLVGGYLAYRLLRGLPAS